MRIGLPDILEEESFDKDAFCSAIRRLRDGYLGWTKSVAGLGGATRAAPSPAPAGRAGSASRHQSALVGKPAARIASLRRFQLRSAGEVPDTSARAGDGH